MSSFDDFVNCCGDSLNHHGLDISTSFSGWHKIFSKFRSGSDDRLRASLSQPVLQGIIKYGLSDQEAFFILSYTASFSSWINLPLRRGEQLTECQELYAKGLDLALSKLPRCDSKYVYRMDSPMCGKEEEFQWFRSRIGSVIRIPCFLSVAKTNWGNTEVTWRIRTHINDSNAADLSQCRNNPSEDELVYRRGSSFRVIGVEDGLVFLEEAENGETACVELVVNYAGCR